MDKAKEIINDPAKLQAALDQAWDQLDAKKEGFVSCQAVLDHLKAQAKALGQEDREATPEEKEQVLKFVDPSGTGKVNKETFIKLINATIAKAKAEKKL